MRHLVLKACERVAQMPAWQKGIVVVFGGTAVAGVAMVAAPLVGAAASAIGIGAGGGTLAGAAAANAGLAALGGGSLAAGGFGVAGGTAVVTTVGGVAGAALTTKVVCDADECGADSLEKVERARHTAVSDDDAVFFDEEDDSVRNGGAGA
ncbi:MAG: hypothetical protein Q8Q09_22245 [Deltaproteobacteria bacterium]|nr:hypothetical protein [Deltaproteobacteria bacterium]